MVRFVSKKHVLILILSLMLQVSVCAVIFTANASATAMVHVNPSEVTDLSLGDTFSINIDIVDVVGLAGWEFKLYYKRDVLNAIETTEGSFLKSAVPPHDSTMFLPSIDYNATHGRVYLACTLLGSGPGASGSGTLASIKFTVIGVGQTPLSLPQDQTILVDPNIQEIPHIAVGGSVMIGGNDIAVTHVQLSKTITNDTNVQINVTVQNNGNYTVTFDVTVYYDENEIETQTVTDLTSESNVNLTFTWDTTPAPKGNYTIKAYAHPIEGEVLVENNLLIDGWIKETILGDVNGDGRVNIVDISLVAISFKTEPGDTKWNPNADVNDDNEINIIDMSKVAIHYGEVDP